MILFSFLINILMIPHFQTDLETPVGYWKSIDDQSGDARSIVELYENEGLLHGAIRDLLQEEDSTLCSACKGENHNKPIVGLEIIRGMKIREERWVGGTILDPETGGSYKCILWLEDGGKQLKVRGKHWTGLYRTQTWYRAESN